jgi:DNA repair exonuclease SbcCD nuclease subunit
VIAIRGNHDAASVITRSLPWPEQARMLSADRAETVRFAALGVAIHGRSFPNREVLENFVPQYPRPDPGAFNIGLLHTAGTGRPGHAAYAPCTVEQLAAHGYDYWALGHIHTREILGQDPWIVFPGNIQGRHIRETGAKGATLVTVENGAVTAVTHHTLDVVRWEAISVDVTGASDENAALARVLPAFQTALAQAEGRLLAVRVTLTGTTAAHAALAASLGATREKVRAVAAGSGLWIEQAVIATRPPAAAESNDALGKLGQEIAAIAAEDLAALLKPWAEGLLDRASGLRAELPATHPAVLAATGTVTPELLERARDLLLARLAEA